MKVLRFVRATGSGTSNFRDGVKEGDLLPSLRPRTGSMHTSLFPYSWDSLQTCMSALSVWIQVFRPMLHSGIVRKVLMSQDTIWIVVLSSSIG